MDNDEHGCDVGANDGHRVRVPDASPHCDADCEY